MEDIWNNRKEAFEYVCLKPGKSALTAEPGDFERVFVEATDPLQALMSDEVQAKRKEGYSTLFAAKPGVMTDPEIQARARVSSIRWDKTKL